MTTNVTNLTLYKNIHCCICYISLQLLCLQTRRQVAASGKRHGFGSRMEAVILYKTHQQLDIHLRLGCMQPKLYALPLGL